MDAANLFTTIPNVQGHVWMISERFVTELGQNMDQNAAKNPENTGKKSKLTEPL